MKLFQARISNTPDATPSLINTMKLPLLTSLLTLLFICSGVSLAQDKIIVLVRHAEKDASPSADKMDPDLSGEGRDRAERLAKAIKRYKPHEIFSTDYKRTKQTAEPTAKRRKKQVQIYDPAKPSDLVQKIMDPASRTVRYLIVGHSNTIPGLANMLFRKEIFRNLPDPEHGVFWVIKIRNGVPTEVDVRPY